jgi:hypothetical protein
MSFEKRTVDRSNANLYPVQNVEFLEVSRGNIRTKILSAKPMFITATRCFA